MTAGAVTPSGSTSGVLNGSGAIAGPLPIAALSAIGGVADGGVSVACGHGNAGDGITGQPGVVAPKGA
jgi:hypothetical protein